MLLHHINFSYRWPTFVGCCCSSIYLFSHEMENLSLT